jgi:hypothetical protein
MWKAEGPPPSDSRVGLRFVDRPADFHGAGDRRRDWLPEARSVMREADGSARYFSLKGFCSDLMSISRFVRKIRSSSRSARFRPENMTVSAP